MFHELYKKGRIESWKIHLFWSLWYMVENWQECISSTEADQHAYLRQSAVRKSRGLERLNSVLYICYIYADNFYLVMTVWCRKVILEDEKYFSLSHFCLQGPVGVIVNFYVHLA